MKRAAVQRDVAMQAAPRGQTARANGAEAVIRQAAERAKETHAALLKQLSGVFPTVDTCCGLMVLLGGINFETGKADLTPAAREKPALPAGTLSAHPGLVLDIEGHTDNVGSPKADQALSEARPVSLRDLLKEKGFAAGKMWTTGFGQEERTAGNDTEEGRARNRRAEIIARARRSAPSLSKPRSGALPARIFLPMARGRRFPGDVAGATRARPD